MCDLVVLRKLAAAWRAGNPLGFLSAIGGAEAEVAELDAVLAEPGTEMLRAVLEGYALATANDLVAGNARVQPSDALRLCAVRAQSTALAYGVATQELHAAAQVVAEMSAKAATSRLLGGLLSGATGASGAVVFSADESGLPGEGVSPAAAAGTANFGHVAAAVDALLDDDDYGFDGGADVAPSGAPSGAVVAGNSTGGPLLRMLSPTEPLPAGPPSLVPPMGGGASMNGDGGGSNEPRNVVAAAGPGDGPDDGTFVSFGDRDGAVDVEFVNRPVADKASEERAAAVKALESSTMVSILPELVARALGPRIGQVTRVQVNVGEPPMVTYDDASVIVLPQVFTEADLANALCRMHAAVIGGDQAGVTPQQAVATLFGSVRDRAIARSPAGSLDVVCAMVDPRSGALVGLEYNAEHHDVFAGACVRDVICSAVVGNGAGGEAGGLAVVASDPATRTSILRDAVARLTTDYGVKTVVVTTTPFLNGWSFEGHATLAHATMVICADRSELAPTLVAKVTEVGAKAVVIDELTGDEDVDGLGVLAASGIPIVAGVSSPSLEFAMVDGVSALFGSAAGDYFRESGAGALPDSLFDTVVVAGDDEWFVYRGLRQNAAHGLAYMDGAYEVERRWREVAGGVASIGVEWETVDGDDDGDDDEYGDDDGDDDGDSYDHDGAGGVSGVY